MPNNINPSPKVQCECLPKYEWCKNHNKQTNEKKQNKFKSSIVCIVVSVKNVKKAIVGAQSKLCKWQWCWHIYKWLELLLHFLDYHSWLFFTPVGKATAWGFRKRKTEINPVTFVHIYSWQYCKPTATPLQKLKMTLISRKFAAILEKRKTSAKVETHCFYLVSRS